MTADPPSRAADLFATALAHHQAGRLDLAETLYHDLLRADPRHGMVLANLAVLHQQRGALDTAEHWYQRALALQRTPELLSNLAMLRRARGDLRAAERLLREALFLRPDFPDALYNLGTTLIEADRPAEAIDPLTKRARDPAAGADVHANLARALHAVGRTAEALPHGRHALLLKDAQACQSFRSRSGQALARAPAPPFDASRTHQNVIAFSLWGTRATYVDGAIANANLARSLYPGWTCRFYLDESVPGAARDALTRAGAQLMMMPRATPPYGLFWRFFAADDPSVRYFLCRDTDSRLNAQEAEAVAAWLRSGQSFHIMRDAPFHTELMLAGLWGGVGGRLGGIRNAIDQYYRAGDHRWIDQDFLRAEVWPRIRELTLIHDSCYDLFGAQPFPRVGRLSPPHHVGAGYVITEREGESTRPG